MIKSVLFPAITAAGLLACSSLHGATIINGDFSSTTLENQGNGLEALLPADAGLWKSNDNNRPSISGGTLIWQADRDQSRPVSQVIDNADSTTGAGYTFDFSLSAILDNDSENDFYVHVIGWNDGDAAPLVDHRGGNTVAGTASVLVVNDAVSLVGGPLEIIVNGQAGSDGIGFISGQSNDLSFGVNFGTGYDNVAVIFDNTGAGASFANHIVDDVAFVAVPEPSAALLGSIGCLLLLRRRR